MTPPTISFPALVQDFFQRRLAAERAASAHTIERQIRAGNSFMYFTLPPCAVDRRVVVND